MKARYSNMKKVVVSLLLLTLPLVLAGAATAGEKVLMFGTDSEPIGFDPHTIPAVASSRMIFQMYNVQHARKHGRKFACYP